MDNLFEEFAKPGYQDWVNQLIKDLKGQPEELIQRDDQIEELQFNSYQHQDSNNTSPVSSLNNPYIRQVFRSSNQWENIGNVVVVNEETANKQALQYLNMGATALRFDVRKHSNLNWEQLTAEIQLEYIETTVVVSSYNQFSSIQSKLSGNRLNNVYFELELADLKQDECIHLANNLKKKQQFVLLANGYAIQQCGATTWQEISYSLAVAHEYLVRLTELGLTVDEAAACIHFNTGAGAQYFYEIAKIRALRILWSRIVEEYQPTHTCTYAMRVTGITGFTNKSLKDPYTNLLRQTTETMSLIFGGVHAVCVQPYDAYSTKGATTLSTRMAVNIPLILQEESFLEKVIDPLGGSYTLEYLTNEIADKAWDEFRKLEEFGGIENEAAIAYLKTTVQQKAALRKQRISDKSDTLIGINIFPNPSEDNNEWLPADTYLGIPGLTLEQSI